MICHFSGGQIDENESGKWNELGRQLRERERTLAL